MVRHKQRYLVVKITAHELWTDLAPILHTSALYHTISEKVQQLHGDFGSAAIRAGLSAKYFNKKTQIGVIRCRHGPHKLITSALPFIKDMNNVNVHFSTLYTGATLKHCFKFILNYQKQRVDEICATLQNEEERDQVKSELLHLKMSLD